MENITQIQQVLVAITASHHWCTQTFDKASVAQRTDPPGDSSPRRAFPVVPVTDYLFPSRIKYWLCISNTLTTVTRRLFIESQILLRGWVHQCYEAATASRTLLLSGNVLLGELRGWWTEITHIFIHASTHYVLIIQTLLTHSEVW